MEKYIKTIEPNVLIVDDNYLNFQVINSNLTNRNLSSIWVENGFEAIKVVFSNIRIDLIFMDYVMPVMDGITTSKLIRNHFTHLPIILHSSINDSNLIQNAKVAGCNDFLPKPFQQSELDKILEEYLS